MQDRSYTTQNLQLRIKFIQHANKVGFLILTMHLTGRIASSSRQYTDGPMNHEARTVFNTIQALFTSRFQLQTFNALMTAFLEADGNLRPEHAPLKSPSAFSRLLNQYDWNASCSQDSTSRAVRARTIIRAIRTAVTTRIWSLYAKRKGRRPVLEIMLDLTTLEKTGKFPNLEIHLLAAKPAPCKLISGLSTTDPTAP